MKKLLSYIGLVLLLCAVLVTGCTSSGDREQNQQQQNEQNQEKQQDQQNEQQDSGQSKVESESYITLDEVPEYSGNAYIAIEDNVPSFTEKEKTTTSFETYSPLDALGRCGVAYANVGQDLMPTEARESISQVKPTGWQSIKYDHVDGKYLYNRCHLIGFQLTAENANDKNLITGTRYLNIDGMLLFENMIADYVKETGNHVLYRVTPIFKGNNLVASGVHMEAYSVEDEGEGISFNVYAYNVQPGVTIDYATGESKLSEAADVKPSESVNQVEEPGHDTSKQPADEAAQQQTNQVVDKQVAPSQKVEIRGNSNSMIYHCPGQASYENMADSKYLVVFESEEEAIKAGYRKAKR